MRKFLSVIICMFCITTTAWADGRAIPSLDLINCVKSGDLECVKNKTRGWFGWWDVNAKDLSGYTVLMLAAQDGHLDIVQYLVDNGADVDAKDWLSGYTVLMLATQNGHLDIVQYLVEHGADKDAKDNNGKPALIWATQDGHLDIVKCLVDKGADKDAKDNDGMTALMWATQDGHLDIVKCLVEHGADKDAKSKSGKTALDLAKAENKTEVVNYLTALMAQQKPESSQGNDAPAGDSGPVNSADATTDRASVAETASGSSEQQDDSAAKRNAAIDRTTKIKGIVTDITTLNSGFGRSHWKTANGNFNGARLASDSIAGVVLGTAGGLITSNIIKKNQTKSGFENLKCTVNGQVISDYGDEFTVGMH